MKTKHQQQQQQHINPVNDTDDDVDVDVEEEDLCNSLNRIVRLNSNDSTNSSSTSGNHAALNSNTIVISSSSSSSCVSETSSVTSASPVLICDNETNDASKLTKNQFKLSYSICGKSKKSSLISLASPTKATETLLPILDIETNLKTLFNFGDDVCFNYENDDFYFFGLADGVSGNSKKGFDAKLFPLALLTISQYLLENEYDSTFKLSLNSLLFDLLCKSHQIVQDKCVYGSSTVCLLALNKYNLALNTLNLGDSGYLLIRDNQVFYKSVAQSHRYNAPYQIGCTPPELCEFDLYRDMPEDSICLQHLIKTGDYLLLSSDGLFDNLYEDEIALIIQNHVQDKEITQELLDSVCEKLVEKACKAEIKRDDTLLVLIHIE